MRASNSYGVGAMAEQRGVEVLGHGDLVVGRRRLSSRAGGVRCGRAGSELQSPGRLSVAVSKAEDVERGRKDSE